MPAKRGSKRKATTQENVDKPPSQKRRKTTKQQEPDEDLDNSTNKKSTPTTTTTTKRGSKKKASTTTAAATGKNRRASRGLRQFSHKVCEKVQQKGSTTYTEVAKELVDEYAEETHKDAKNIRRRVYDALNVLLAMDIITKDKKVIRWKGYPANFKHKSKSNLEPLKRQIETTKKSLDEKNRQFEELKSQNNALQTLYDRNAKSPTHGEHNKVKMPFIIVHTSKETVIECQMDTKATEVFFNFSEPFEIHNDSELLMHIFNSQHDPMSIISAENSAAPKRTTETTTPSHPTPASSKRVTRSQSSNRNGAPGDTNFPASTLHTPGRRDRQSSADLMHHSHNNTLDRTEANMNAPPLGLAGQYRTPSKDNFTPQKGHLGATPTHSTGFSPGRPLLFPSPAAHHHHHSNPAHTSSQENLLSGFPEGMPFAEAPSSESNPMLVDADFNMGASGASNGQDNKENMLLGEHDPEG